MRVVRVVLMEGGQVEGMGEQLMPDVGYIGLARVKWGIKRVSKA